MLFCANAYACDISLGHFKEAADDVSGQGGDLIRALAANAFTELPTRFPQASALMRHPSLLRVSDEEKQGIAVHYLMNESVPAGFGSRNNRQTPLADLRSVLPACPTERLDFDTFFSDENLTRVAVGALGLASHARSHYGSIARKLVHIHDQAPALAAALHAMAALDQQDCAFGSLLGVMHESTPTVSERLAAKLATFDAALPQVAPRLAPEDGDGDAMFRALIVIAIATDMTLPIQNIDDEGVDVDNQRAAGPANDDADDDNDRENDPEPQIGGCAQQ